MLAHDERIHKGSTNTGGSERTRALLACVPPTVHASSFGFTLPDSTPAGGKPEVETITIDFFETGDGRAAVVAERGISL